MAQLVEWCGCAAPLAARRDVADCAGGPHARGGAHDSDGGPALDVSGEVPHVAAEAFMAAAGRRLVVIEAVDGAHANVALEATEGGLYRPQAAPRRVRVWRRAPRTRWPAACSF